jgi:nucleoside-diphosphate-sugar epimerase
MVDNARRVLVTGAFGTIGRETLGVLADRGFEVVATDLSAPGNRALEAGLRHRCAFTTEWADIADPAQVAALVERVAPGCVIHLASVIPPHVYADAERARRINLEGTRHLVEAACRLSHRPLFVLASSHTVHGYRNGARDLPPLRAADPRQGCDLYTRLKIACEDLVRASGLDWTILRYGIVFPKVYSKRIDPAGVRLSFLVPLDSRAHGVHVEDAGYATARCAEGLAVGRVLMIGGGEQWKQRQRFFMENILGAVGVGMLPESAFLQPDPARDESWYYVDWMDTAEGEALLGYQRHEPEDFFRGLSQSMGLLRPLARLASPLVRRKMARLSPFYGGEVDPGAPGMDLDERIRRYATPPAAP